MEPGRGRVRSAGSCGFAIADMSMEMNDHWSRELLVAAGDAVWSEAGGLASAAQAVADDHRAAALFVEHAQRPGISPRLRS